MSRKVADQVELVDEAELPPSPQEDWPESLEEEEAPAPSQSLPQLPEEQPDDRGSDFDPDDEDMLPTGPLDDGWADRTCDEDPTDFPDDGLLEPEH